MVYNLQITLWNSCFKYSLKKELVRVKRVQQCWHKSSWKVVAFTQEETSPSPKRGWPAHSRRQVAKRAAVCPSSPQACALFASTLPQKSPQQPHCGASSPEVPPCGCPASWPGLRTPQSITRCGTTRARAPPWAPANPYRTPNQGHQIVGTPLLKGYSSYSTYYFEMPARRKRLRDFEQQLRRKNLSQFVAAIIKIV